MKIIKINREIVDADVVKLVTDILRNGGVVVHPTDTCYGLAADVFNKAAVDKVAGIKQMAKEKPISVIAGDLNNLHKFVYIDESTQKIIDQYWPGALTIVFKRKKVFPLFYNNGNETIGIRYPKCGYSLAFAKSLSGFITTTSANVTGSQNPYSLHDILREFDAQKLKPDLVLDAGLLPEIKPSTIVKVENDKIEILRRGELEL
ncbi:MAG: Sua5/YciO/YrdC/YwlC family protein [Candidatus Peregrinibacteria bacterium GW2011_GWA2_33_10]|nr:MAG: Sua5/YciO/YrdC/YwlC family protein [Candidatus Peregrinibacteria bacterium GW2011_GWA2_33_10]KKP40780.1 MAG: Sua5/YciO/YrdC/YwlC family protein, tRNA threonylcarbamoyladenosine biosynthesis protein [Candidatus Peregrinibacteria bacterium GW2011_GWC2_33_13]OGJ50943.1 MAG: threonylcarbamoyl-AMP synthase [Candidatus Peregrinibacteria bacterium RIFOXYA2_FULL_33_7]